MPIRKLVRNVNAKAAELRARLAQEWRDPKEEAGQPVIVEEKDAAEGALHLYVVWDAWAGVSQQERSEIIMEAYEESHTGPNGEIPNERFLFQVTVAMGLTPEEAKRIGIAYQ